MRSTKSLLSYKPPPRLGSSEIALPRNPRLKLRRKLPPNPHFDLGTRTPVLALTANRKPRDPTPPSCSRHSRGHRAAFERLRMLSRLVLPNHRTRPVATLPTALSPQRNCKRTYPTASRDPTLLPRANRLNHPLIESHPVATCAKAASIPGLTQ
jgi:hypothetical protein